MTDTVVKSKPRARHDDNDRSKWKSLRDFVHERGIEEATESMDNDRVTLDVRVFTATMLYVCMLMCCKGHFSIDGGVSWDIKREYYHFTGIITSWGSATTDGGNI